MACSRVSEEEDVSYGPPRRHWKPEETKRFAELWEQGLPVPKLALLFKRSKWAVCKKAEKLGLSSRKRDWSVEEEVSIRDKVLDLVELLATELDRSSSAVMARLVTILYNPETKFYLKAHSERLDHEHHGP